MVTRRCVYKGKAGYFTGIQNINGLVSTVCPAQGGVADIHSFRSKNTLLFLSREMPPPSLEWNEGRQTVASGELHVQNFVGPRAARRCNLNRVAGLFANQGPRNR